MRKALNATERASVFYGQIEQDSDWYISLKYDRHNSKKVHGFRANRCGVVEYNQATMGRDGKLSWFYEWEPMENGHGYKDYCPFGYAHNRSPVL